VTKGKKFWLFLVVFIVVGLFVFYKYPRPDFAKFVITKTTDMSPEDLEKHKVDAEFALVFAVVYGLPMALIFSFVPDLLKYLVANMFMQIIKNKVRFRFKGVTVNYKTKDGVNTTTSMVVHDFKLKEAIKDVINAKDVIEESSRAHYHDYNNSFHFKKLFRTSKLISDSGVSDLSISRLTQAMAKSLRKVEGIDCAIYISKTSGLSTGSSGLSTGSSLLFANILLQNLTDTDIAAIGLEYEDSSRRISPKNCDVSELRGRKVIIVESLLIYPYVISDVVEWLKCQGADIKRIVLLIDGTMGESKSIYKHSACDVIIGASIDLGLKVRSKGICPPGAEIKILDYKEY
jgi:hypothetical protein